MLFDQFIWTSQLEPPQVWLYAAPFAAVWVGPNFQAHLSPFSFPLASYHAFASDLRLDVGVEGHRAGCARVGPTGLEGSAAGRAAQVLRIDGPVAARAEPPPRKLFTRLGAADSPDAGAMGCPDAGGYENRCSRTVSGSICRTLDCVKLGWEEARALRLERHQLHRRAPRGRELRIAGRICGLHAQLLSSAALSLWARVEGTSLEAFQRALWRDRTLVKIWAMRGTLHLLPAGDLPIYLGALGTYRHYLGQGWVKYFGVTREEIELVIETVGDVLRGCALGAAPARLRSGHSRCAALGRPLSGGAQGSHLPAAGLDLAGAFGRWPRRGCLAARAEDRPPRGADRAVHPPAAQGARGSCRGGGAARSLSRRPPRQAGVALAHGERMKLITSRGERTAFAR